MIDKRKYNWVLVLFFFGVAVFLSSPRNICNYPINKSSYCIHYKYEISGPFFASLQNHPSTKASRDFIKSKNACILLLEFINQIPVIQGGSRVGFHGFRNLIADLFPLDGRDHTKNHKCLGNLATLWPNLGSYITTLFNLASFITLRMSR